MPSTSDRDVRSDRRGFLGCVAILTLTVAQLLVLALAPDMEQAEEKGFGARLAFYPLLMLLAPTVWALVRWLRSSTAPMPWTPFALMMSPFLVDVTGNTLDLYDQVPWWDDANHFGNWVLLCCGLGLLMLQARMTPPWALGITVTGAGAVLAILWELGEWWTFIRHGTERRTAYEDTLADETLGTLGGAVAAVIITRVGRRRVASRE